ncbi:NAD(P)-dependent oxidoreductase [Paenibacillus sp. 481]|uniref:NAD(P)-dependent oxidoreductase n=1 Tax=Paenibacillus sp. 481 TaxID=2835869 RepID=UPI001E5B50B5|nr:NAD(P)H-binding protein [Paenibacillus sp. 481]UHA75533.1 NAD(P)H-binding protein [Paenibacillus sp. 481]
MNILVYGASGNIGQRIVGEALQRGHHVTAVVRDAARVTQQHPSLKVVVGSIEQEQIAQMSKGQDAIISAYGPAHGNEAQLNEVTRHLITGAKLAGTRLLAVGGAGSLKVSADSDMKVVESPNFPEAWKPNAYAQGEALNMYLAEQDLDWTYLSPAGLIQAGERTGRYRVSTDTLVVDAEGNSHISYEDYAVAMIDELEKPQFARNRFTAAY